MIFNNYRRIRKKYAGMVLGENSSHYGHNLNENGRKKVKVSDYSKVIADILTMSQVGLWQQPSIKLLRGFVNINL